jgi:elongation factor Ts
MAEITAKAVMALREATTLPMMLCKKALVEAEGDFDKAVDILKRDVENVKVKRADNETAEGRVFTLVADDGSEAVMVEVQCESAPVGSGENLAEMGALLTKQLLEGPGADSPEALLAQQSPDGSGKPLSELFDELVNQIREKIVVTQIIRVAGPVGSYVHHDGKTGVLFCATGEKADAPVLRDVAMHIAALSPTVTTVEDLDPAAVQAERNRLSEEALATSKPENIVEKIVDGRMKNFYAEQGVLVVQPFAKDDSKTVSQALAESGLEAKCFARWKIGS